MPERVRAYHEGKMVTVIEGKVGAKTGKTRVRNGLGFVIEVKSRDLSPVPKSEPGAVLKFGGGSD